ncbi:MAG: GNAT family N-acetyltransferase [Sedimentisphaerales bacterium]|nr:GNAT family N-acetyltransferase [Sedimentisphaerales bacterium]
MEFRSPFQFERGTLFELLCESYAGLLEAKPAWAATYRERWRHFDDFVFDHPDSIGRLLVSCIDDRPLGFVSWDPRRLPQEGRIGQNCIVPSQRGHGYGSLQIRQAVAILTAQGARRIVVDTDSHAFFALARQMYLSCGFTEVSHTPSEDFGGMELVRYEYVMGYR